MYMYMYACTYVHQQPLTVLRMSSMYPSSSCTRASPSLVFTRYTPSLWAPWYSPKFCAGTSHICAGTCVLCRDITHVCTSMYHSRCCVHVHTTAGAVGEDRVLHVYVHTVHVCISSWLALISVAYCPSARLSVAKQPTQPQNDSTLNITLISIHHVQN